MHRQQLEVIDYLREENRVLREQLRDRRVRLNDDQCRRLPPRLKDWVETSAAGRQHRHLRDDARVAPETDRPQV